MTKKTTTKKVTEPAQGVDPVYDGVKKRYAGDIEGAKIAIKVLERRVERGEDWFAIQKKEALELFLSIYG